MISYELWGAFLTSVLEDSKSQGWSLGWVGYWTGQCCGFGLNYFQGFLGYHSNIHTWA